MYGYVNHDTLRNPAFARPAQDWADRMELDKDTKKRDAMNTSLRNLNVTSNRAPAVLVGSRAALAMGTGDNYGMDSLPTSRPASRKNGLEEIDNIRSNAEGLRPTSKGIAGPFEGVHGPPLSRGSSRKSAGLVPEVVKTAKVTGYLTTNDLVYGLRNLEGSAEIYKDMQELTKAKASKKQNRSEWGEAQKEGDLSLWKESCLTTTNQVVNDEVCPREQMRANPNSRDARKTFLRWMIQNKMYTADLFTEEQAEQIYQKMINMDQKEQEQYLNGIRNMHTAVQPNKAPYMSVTHADFRKPHTLDDPEMVKLASEENRARTYGRHKMPKFHQRVPPPKKPEPEPLSPAQAYAEKRDALLQASKLEKVAEENKKNLQGSLSLVWPGNNMSKGTSEAQEAFKGYSRKSYTTDRSKPAKTVNPYVQPGAAYGPLNEMAFPELAEAHRTLHAVPGYFVSRKADLPTKETKVGLESTYERRFLEPQGKTPADVAEEKQVQRERMVALRTSRVPLGVNGIQYKDRGTAVSHDFYVPKPINTQWREERIAAIKAEVNAPTITAGRMAPFLETREDRLRRTRHSPAVSPDGHTL